MRLEAAVSSTLAPADAAGARELVVQERDFEWLKANREVAEAMAHEQADPTPFHTFEWLDAWWSAFGSGYRARVFTVHSGDRIVGLAPLMASRSDEGVLEWLGAGRSDHCPLLIRNGYEVDGLRALRRYLMQRRDWRVLSLRTVLPSQLEHFREAWGPDLLQETDDVSPRVLIRGSWDDYLAAKSKKHRGNIRRLFRAQENGSVTVACERDFRPELLDEIADIEARSWKRRDGSLRLAGAGAAFYEAFLRGFAARGWSEVWVCRARGVPVAYLVTFCYRDRVFYYNGAYREDYASYVDVSPGSLLIANALRHAHERGMHSFDFLRGDEPYKSLWINEPRPLYHVVLVAPGLRAGIAAIRRVRLRWWLRRSALARRAHAWLVRVRPGRD